MKSIICMSTGHTVLWVVDHDGRIVQSEPEESYTGCWAINHEELKPGDKPEYQTPDRKRTVLLQLPVRSINTLNHGQ